VAIFIQLLPKEGGGWKKIQWQFLNKGSMLRPGGFFYIMRLPVHRQHGNLCLLISSMGLFAGSQAAGSLENFGTFLRFHQPA
jgi:hypothetical protein